MNILKKTVACKAYNFICIGGELCKRLGSAVGSA